MKHLYSLGILLLLLFVSAASKAQIRYATGVEAFSSQYSAGNWAAYQALGLPNVPSCGDNSSAWASRTSDGSREFLELNFADPAPVNRIFIHESYHPGAIDTVYVFNPNTQAYVKVYEATAAAATPCIRTLTIAFPETGFPVSRIRIAVNSQAVYGYNEIDAVGIANYSSDGIVSGSTDVCASAAAPAFVNVNASFNGESSIVYQWQDSIANDSWKDITSAAALTYQPPVVTKNTWYRRKATLAGTVVYSNTLKLTYLESGDPAVFPQDKWNFYAYQSGSLDLGTAIYKGFYSVTGIGFNTALNWGTGNTPSSTTGYQGCVVPNDNFVLVAKRKGFPAGNYQVVTGFSTQLRIYVNGSEVTTAACCNATVSLGALNNNSLVEFRVLDAGSNCYLNTNFQIAELNGGDIGEPQALCLNETPSVFLNVKSAFGGATPASITYQWQDSVAAGTWKNILNATAATFQAGALTDTTFFRRKATDNTNAIAYSDIIRMSVVTKYGDTSVYGNQTWHIYGFNGNQISLAGANYRGFYTFAGTMIDTYAHFGIFGSPSDAAGYRGCPVNNENFILSARREGFPGGRYRLDIKNVDDEMMVLVDGVEKFKGGCCQNLDLGLLNASSKVELRLKEAGYVTRLTVDLVRIDSSISDYQNANCNFYSQTGVSGDQWFDLTDASGKIIASVNPGNNNLGTLYMNAKHFGVGTAKIPKSTINKKLYMPRYFRFYSSLYTNGKFPFPVKLRLYYKNSELEDYKTLSNQSALTRDDLRITHYSGVAEDCDMSNNANQGEMLAQEVARSFTTDGFYVEVTSNSFSEFGAVGGTQILPVSLTMFRATPVNDDVKLNWSTAQELNNKGFEILRSGDGKNFVKIGWVDGHGTTNTPQQYTFTDASPVAGKNFYRLRQVDIDAQSSYSDIVAASTKKILVLNVSPNPVEQTLYIEFDVKNIAGLKMLDMQGRVVWKSAGQPASSILAVPVQHLAKGTYLLEATDKQGNRQTEKFIKK